MDSRGRRIYAEKPAGFQVVIRLNGSSDWRNDHIKLSGYNSYNSFGEEMSSAVCAWPPAAALT